MTMGHMLSSPSEVKISRRVSDGRGCSGNTHLDPNTYPLFLRLGNPPATPAGGCQSALCILLGSC